MTLGAVSNHRFRGSIPMFGAGHVVTRSGGRNDRADFAIALLPPSPKELSSFSSAVDIPENLPENKEKVNEKLFRALLGNQKRGAPHPGFVRH